MPAESENEVDYIKPHTIGDLLGSPNAFFAYVKQNYPDGMIVIEETERQRKELQEANNSGKLDLSFGGDVVVNYGEMNSEIGARLILRNLDVVNDVLRPVGESPFLDLDYLNDNTERLVDAFVNLGVEWKRYRDHTLHWEEQRTNEVLYRTGGLIIHELGNIIGRTIPDAVFMGSSKELVRQLVAFPWKFTSGIEQLYPFFDILERVEKTGDTSVTVGEFLLTLGLDQRLELQIDSAAGSVIATAREVDRDFLGDKSKEVLFDSVEQMLAARTFVDNAQKLSGDDPVRIIRRDVGGITEFEIVDYVGGGKWPEAYIEEVNEAYELGKKVPNAPLFGHTGGGKLVAYRLGQEDKLKGDQSGWGKPEFKNNLESKSVVIRYRNS